MAFAPLAGFHVLDLTSSLAGPTCTQILGALGADIVKVEHPQRGDEARAWGPRFFEGGSVMFFAANTSKRSLALDVKSPEGKEALLRLVDRSDVFVQSLRPGTAERLGLGYEALHARNGRLVYCSIGAFGRRGPLTAQPGYDPLMQAFTGIVSITGERDRPGVRVGTSLIDLGTGVWAALGVLAALHERAETGRGREVDVALFETGLSLVGYQLTDALRTGLAPARFGTAFPLIAPYEVFPTSDGELMIAAANDRLFAQLCAGIDRPELAEDPRFKTPQARWDNRAEFDAILGAWTGARSKHEVMKLMGDAGVPCGATLDTGEVLADPHLKAREMIVDIDYPTRGTYQTVGCPVKLSDSPVSITRPPMLGEHTGDLLGALCGVAPGDVKRLRDKGVV